MPTMITKTALALTLACGAASLVATPAFAAKCKNVYIDVKNERSSEIKVYRLQYFDSNSNKTRTNNLNNATVAIDQSVPFRETLEHVGGEAISWTKVEYKYKTGGKWSSKRWSDRGEGTNGGSCATNDRFLVTVR